MNTYPIFLNGLGRRRCFVLGGDEEARRKVAGLLDCDADVTVVARSVTAGLRTLVDANRVRWIARDYRQGDLAGAFLVIVTGRDERRNAAACAEAGSQGALINAVDDVEHCSFIAGSLVRRGPLVVAISTGGCAPALAVRLRQRFEKMLGPEHGLFLQWMRKLRRILLKRFPDFEIRREIWYRLVDSEILELLRKGNTKQARRKLEEIANPQRSVSP